MIREVFMFNNNEMMRRMMSGGVTKPVNLGATLGRFWFYAGGKYANLRD